MVICQDCGKDVKDAKFCSNCGALLKKSEAVPAEETSEVQETGAGFEEASENVKEEPVKETPAGTKKSKFCTNCGFELNGDFKFCPECGHDLSRKLNNTSPGSPSVGGEEKNMVLAVVLSVIFPGLGQFYLGLNNKGVLFLIGYIISAILVLLIIGALLCLVIWIWALVDTIQSTNAINNGEYVEDKLF